MTGKELAFTIVASVLVVFTFFTISVVRVTANDNRKIVRNERVQIACVENSGTFANNVCVVSRG